MAEKEVKISIDIEGVGKSITDINGLSTATDKLKTSTDGADKSITDLDATFEDVYGELKPLTARMGELEDRLYELANAGDTTSKEFQDLTQKVANYKKIQEQTDRTIENASLTMDQKLGGALQGAASAFAGVQGAMALMGTESEQLEQTLVKVQGAMALAEGVRGVREGVGAFKAIGESAKTALAGIRTGIAATGVGVFLIALGAIVAYWDDIKQAMGGVSSEQKKLNTLAEGNLKAEQDKLVALEGNENSLRLQGKSEREILTLKIAQTNEAIAAAIATQEGIKEANRLAEEGAKRNQGFVQKILGTVTNPATAFAVSKWLFDPEETKKKGDGVLSEAQKTLQELVSKRDGYALAIKGIDTQSNKTAIDTAKQKEADLETIRLAGIDTVEEQRAEELRLETKKFDDLIALAKKHKQDTTQLEEAKGKAIKGIKAKFRKEDADAEAAQNAENKNILEQIRQGEIVTEQQKRDEELRIVREKYQNLISEAIRFGEDTTALKTALRTTETQMQAGWDADDAAKQKAKDDERKAQIIELKNFEIAAEEDLYNIKMNILADTAYGLSAFADESKGIALAVLAIQKGLAIADVVTNSTKSIGNIVADGAREQAAISAFYAPFGPFGVAPMLAQQATASVRTKKRILGTKIGAGVSIAAIAAAGFASGKAILNPPTVDTGGGGNGGSGAQTAAFNPAAALANEQQINRTATIQQTGSQSSIKAYVVSNEMTTQQEADNKIKNLSRL
jgi:hypothetical protein